METFLIHGCSLMFSDAFLTMWMLNSVKSSTDFSDLATHENQLEDKTQFLSLSPTPRDLNLPSLG